MAKRRTRTDAPTPARSAKAGRPPKDVIPTGHTAVRKDTMLMQTDRGPRVRWPASRPEFKKS
jgi:hypothetical protein